MRCRLIKEFLFEASHSLPYVPESHKCARVHGHSFRVEVAVEGEVDPATGWIYDHQCISQAMNPLLETLDHSHLNELPELANPTIETLCGWFWKRLAPKLPGLCEITVQETPHARCVYRGE